MSLDRPNLLDIAKATDPDGKPAKVIEILTQTNPILQDAPAFASNAQLAERVTLRASLPTVQWAQLNKGTVRSKGSYRQRVDTIAFLDGMSECDARLQEAIGQDAVNAYRHQEDKGFLEAMNQAVALCLLYGNELTAPTQFTGLLPRMPSLATAITGSQVRSLTTAVGGGDTTSIVIVDWGEDSCHLIYPRDGGGTAGVKVEDLGRIRVNDVDSNPMMAWVTQFLWFVGLTVKDPRHIARLCNIDRSDANLTLTAPTQSLLVYTLIDIFNSMPDPGARQRVMYTHRDIVAAFHKQALNKTNIALTIEQYHGQPTTHFMGYPLRRLDQFADTEATVT